MPTLLLQHSLIYMDTSPDHIYPRSRCAYGVNNHLKTDECNTYIVAVNQSREFNDAHRNWSHAFISFQMVSTRVRKRAGKCDQVGVRVYIYKTYYTGQRGI